MPDVMNVYLGDGVYAQLDKSGGGIILTTGSHILTEAPNTIYLEPGVLEGLLLFLQALRLSGILVSKEGS